MNYHPDVLAAHAEFGGDIQSMQALYDRPDHIARIAALEAQLAEVKGKLNEIACWSQSQGLLWWQVKAREALSALEATPPAPKVTEADMEWVFQFRENWVNDGSRPNYQQMAKAYAAKMHPWEAAASIYEGRFEDALTAAQEAGKP